MGRRKSSPYYNLKPTKMSAIATDNKTIISVNGLDIRENSVYRVTNKPDSSAPSGFQDEGTTKLPSLGVGNTVPCRAVGKLFDTGLYEQSPCYANKEPKEVKKIVANLKKTIITPYERLMGQPGLLNNSNEEFWINFGVNLYDKRFFDTNNVEDLLGLYIAMRSFELTPKNQLGNPKYNDSQYCIEDKQQVRNVETERANEMMNAIGDFQAMIRTNPTKVLNIFRYIGVIAYNEKVDTETLNAMAHTWLNKDFKNPKQFTKIYNMTQDDATEDVVDLFVLVNKLYHNGTIERRSGSYYYKGENLGADIKTVANNLNSKKELSDIRVELMEQS